MMKGYHAEYWLIYVNHNVTSGGSLHGVRMYIHNGQLSSQNGGARKYIFASWREWVEETLQD